jgi:protein-disulfide isomerase
MKRILPIILIVLVLAVAVAAAWYMKRTATDKPAPENAIGAATEPGGTGSTTASPGAEPPHVRGPEKAPVTLEEFGDFQCPPCGTLYPVLKSVEAEYGPRLRVIFREYPLTPNHEHALAAAKAAEAAGMQGKFFEMHDLIYENQNKWKEMFDVRAEYEGYAKQIGLDVERWKKDQNSDTVDRRIFLDGTRAHSLGVKGTPTVYLNGQDVPFEQLTPEGLRAAINQALSKAGK